MSGALLRPPGFRRLTLGGDFVHANGPLYENVSGERYRLGFHVQAQHTNTMGICHGGMLATFCDMLLPIAAIRSVESLRRRFLPTVSLQLDYMGPAKLGAWVEGEAQVLRTTRSMVFMQGLVTADGEPAVRASGVFKIGPEAAQPVDG